MQNKSRYQRDVTFLGTMPNKKCIINLGAKIFISKMDTSQSQSRRDVIFIETLQIYIYNSPVGT